MSVSCFGNGLNRVRGTALKLGAIACVLGAVYAPKPVWCQTVMAQLPTLHAAGCADFRGNPDGSWTAVNPIVIEQLGVASGISAGQTFPAGMVFSGHNLGDWLNHHCAPAPLR